MSVFVSGASGVGALRAIRVLRVLRLLTVLPNLQRSVIVLGRVIAKAAPFLLLVFLVYYIFALLGMQLFGGACTSAEDPLLPTFGFSTLWEALLAVFTLSLGDVSDMFAAMSCSSGAAAVYYLSGGRRAGVLGSGARLAAGSVCAGVPRRVARVPCCHACQRAGKQCLPAPMHVTPACLPRRLPARLPAGVGPCLRLSSSSPTALAHAPAALARARAPAASRRPSPPGLPGPQPPCAGA
jgi:hypothetical protein